MKSFETVALSPGLYIVATPIGNLRDMTLRALDVLASVDLIVCEDTRVTGKLLNAFGISKKMLPYNDHNAANQRGPVLEKLSGGGRIALVSDAGMPLVSDPGYKLVRDCLDLGIFVTSLPGANAPLTALQLSGLPSDKFCFLGFLPAKRQARLAVMKEWKDAPGTLAVFETGPRLCDSLEDMLEAWGDRPAAVVREMTKLFEQSRRGSLLELAAFYRDDGAPKGEIVVVVGGPPEREYADEDLEKMVAEALETMSVKEASAHVARETGVSKKKLYEMALGLKEEF